MYRINNYSSILFQHLSAYNYNRILYVFTFSFVTCCNSSSDIHKNIKNSGRSFYISGTGNDNSDGSYKKPFASIAKLNALSLKPGDAIFFEGGHVYKGLLSLMLNGSEKDSVYISSYGEGTPVIDGGDSLAMSLGGRYFSVGNIELKGAGRKDGNTDAGLQLIEASHATIHHLHVHGFQKAGVGLWNCNNILLDHIIAEENGFAGIFVQGTDVKLSKNIVVRNSTARNNPGDPTNLDNHSGNGILVAFSTNVLIERCTATNNGWDMPRIGNGPVGIWGYESDSLTIQYCISYKNKTHKGAKDGGGFDFDGGVRNSILQYNLSYENEGAGYGLFQYYGATPWYNNIMRHNVSFNDATATEGSGGIFVWSNDPDSNHLSGCKIYNNVVYSTHRPAIEFEPQSLNTSFLFTNNIFIGRGALVNGPSSGEKFVGNVWWSPDGKSTFRNYSSLGEWSEKTGQEMLNGKLAGVYADPMINEPFPLSLTDPYQLDSLINHKLQPGSPMKTRGIDIAAP